MTAKKQLTIEPMELGEVRMCADLMPDEIRHGVYVRGLDAEGARALAAELIAAADEVDRDSGHRTQR